MYERILVAIDESEAAGRVIAAAEELAKLSSGEIWRSSTSRTGPSSSSDSDTAERIVGASCE